MTQSQLIEEYHEGRINFTGLVRALYALGTMDREEAYMIARLEEDKKMAAIAKRGWEKQDG